MLRTRTQLENLSKKELIEELITVDNISKLSDFSNLHRPEEGFSKKPGCV